MQGKVNVVAISSGFVFCSFTKTWVFPSLFAVLSQLGLQQPQIVCFICNKEQVADVVTKENNTRFT